MALILRFSPSFTVFDTNPCVNVLNMDIVSLKYHLPSTENIIK